MRLRPAWLVVVAALAAVPASSRAAAVGRVPPVHDARVRVLSTMLAEEGLGEWGFAALVEVEGHRILFDTGLGEDVVLRNARALNVDLATVPDVVISHNHRDHTGGLVTLRREYARASPSALARAWVGQGIFLPRVPPGRWGEGMTAARRDYEAAGGTIVELDGPREILPGVWLTGPVPRTHPERNWSGTGRVQTAAGLVEDTIPEDQALIIDSDRGLVAVLGCGHAGVINTLEHARRVVRDAPVLAVVGGLHLFQKDDASLDWTADRLRALGVQNLIGAHCTGLEAVYRIRARAGLDRAHCVVGAVGASFSLDKGIDPGALAR